MVKFIHFMVIQMVATKVFQKHDVAYDESDLIGAWLELIIQYHYWKKPEHSGSEEHLTKRGPENSVGIISQHVANLLFGRRSYKS